MPYVLKPHVKAALEAKFQEEMEAETTRVIHYMTPRERDGWETFVNDPDTTDEQVEEQWDKWVEEASNRRYCEVFENWLRVIVVVTLLGLGLFVALRK